VSTGYRLRLAVLAMAVALCAAGCAHRALRATCFDYRHRPVGYHWLARRDPTGASVVYYGRDPKTGWTVYVGPDSQYYTFNHPGTMGPGEIGSGWEPHDAYPVKGKVQTCGSHEAESNPVWVVRIAPYRVILIDPLVESLTGPATNLIVSFLLVAILLAVPLEARFRPRCLREGRTEWPQGQELAIALTLAAGLFIIGFHWLILQNGIPILRHDWSWPSDEVELRNFFASIYSPWSMGGIGAPSAYPTLYPLAWLMSALGHFLTTKAVLDIVVVASFFGSFLGVYTVARTQEIGRIGRLGALVAAIVYATSPYFVNEFVAGHYLALVAYGLLPILALIALESEKSRGGLILASNTILAGLVVGFSAVQVQYFVFDAVLLALMCVTSPRPIRLGLFAISAMVIGLLAQGFSISNLLFADRAGASLPMQSTLEWFRDMSVVPQLSVLGYGYLVDYARWIFVSDVPDAFWYAAGFTGLLCVALTLFVVRLLRWPLVFLTGVFLASGTIGPGAGLKESVYLQLGAASLVRELYNCTAITLMGLAICLGLAADWMTQRATTKSILALRVPLGCGLLLVVVASVMPFLSGKVSTFIYLWTPSASYEELGDRLSGSPTARLAFLPAAAPLHSIRTVDFSGHSFAGTDFWQTEFRGHPLVFEYEPSTAAAVALAALGREDYREAALVYGLVGVKYLVSRREIESYYSRFWFRDLFPPSWSNGSALKRAEKARGSLRRTESNKDFDVYENLFYTPVLSVADKLVTCDRSLVYEAAFGRVAGCTSVPHLWPVMTVPSPDHDSFNPFVAWVSTQKFFFIDRSTALHWESVFTLSARPYVMRFSLHEKQKIYWSCIGGAFANIIADGQRTLRLACAPEGSPRDHWQTIGILPAGRHELLVKKGPGAMLLNPVLAYPWNAKIDPPIDPVEVAVMSGARQQADGTSLSFVRNEPDKVSGAVVCPHSCVLVFSDSFSPRWKMIVDGRKEVSSVQVNLTENSFEVGPGQHTFMISYTVWRLAQAALLVQTYLWPIGGTLLLLVFAGRMLCRNRT
jgi:hypothetical protein